MPGRTRLVTHSPSASRASRTTSNRPRRSSTTWSWSKESRCPAYAAAALPPTRTASGTSCCSRAADSGHPRGQGPASRPVRCLDGGRPARRWGRRLACVASRPWGDVIGSDTHRREAERRSELPTVNALRDRGSRSGPPPTPSPSQPADARPARRPAAAVSRQASSSARRTAGRWRRPDQQRDPWYSVCGFGGFGGFAGRASLVVTPNRGHGCTTPRLRERREAPRSSAEGELDEEPGDERPQDHRPDQIPGPRLRARVELPSTRSPGPTPPVKVQVGEEHPHDDRDIEA